MEVSVTYLFTTLALLAALYYWATKDMDYFRHKRIPSLPALPLIGSMYKLKFQRVSYYDYIKQIYNKYPDVKVFGLFDMTRPTFVIRDPELIKQLGVKDFDHFTDHVPMFGGPEYDHPNLIAGQTLFALKGQRWRNMRSTLSPAFTGSKMRQMYELIVDCSERTAQHYLQEIRAKGPQIYEMKTIFTRFTGDVIASCAFGLQIDSCRYPENDFLVNGRKITAFSRFSATLRFILLDLAPWLLYYLGIDIIDEEQNTYFRRLIMSAINEREAKGIIRPDMINLLIQARKGILKHQQEHDDAEGFATVQESDLGKGQTLSTLTDTDMVAQCMVFFVAGFDVVSTCLVYTAYELAINRDIQDKLYEEVKKTKDSLEGKPLTYDAMQKMKFMHMVVSESLRKWPTAPHTDRVCTKDYTLDLGNGLKFTMEKGTGLLFPVQGLHHDPKYFPYPERFDPERFNDERKASINAGTYLPFGIGPRNCIGKRFGLAEVKTIFYYLLVNFSIERTHLTEVPPIIAKGITDILPVNGMHLEFKPRSN